MMGKGSKTRPKQITREEEDLRWAYAQGRISYNQFFQKHTKFKRAGLIKRSGVVLK